MSKGARFTIDQLPDKARQQVLAQLADDDARRAGRLSTVIQVTNIPAVLVVEAKPKERRLRQDHKPLLNKLETAYLDEVLSKQYKEKEIYAQSLRVRLANGLWYKVDFWIPHLNLCIEVKGPKAFRGAFEMLKTAADKYSNFKYLLVWREKKLGPWITQEVIR